MTDPNMKQLIQGLTYQRGINDGIAITVGSKDAVGSLFNIAFEQGKKEQLDNIAIHQISAAAQDKKSSNWGILDPASGLFALQDPRHILPALINATSVPHVAQMLKGDAKDNLRREIKEPSKAFRRSNRTTGVPYTNSWSSIFARADPADRFEYTIPLPSGPVRAEGLKFGAIQWFAVPKRNP